MVVGRNIVFVPSRIVEEGDSCVGVVLLKKAGMVLPREFYVRGNVEVGL